MWKNHVTAILSTDFADEKSSIVSEDAHSEMTLVVYKLALSSRALWADPMLQGLFCFVQF